VKNPPDPRATRTGGGVLRRVALCAHKPQDADADPHVATAGDSAVVAAWRERLGTDAAQALYTERAATAEYVTAQVPCGLTRRRVRGTPSVRCVLLHVLDQHLMRTFALAPELPRYGNGAPTEPLMAI